WLYIIEADQSPEQAKANLQQRYQQDRSEEWGWVLVALMLRDVSDEAALAAIMDGTRENYRLAQRLTETYFYLGKRHQLEG
ncbi:lipoprotein NlpI, partial [Escherichia coli]|nr:lipoprotein NlpI [Escherichia coli]